MLPGISHRAQLFGGGGLLFSRATFVVEPKLSAGRRAASGQSGWVGVGVFQHVGPCSVFMRTHRLGRCKKKNGRAEDGGVPGSGANRPLCLASHLLGLVAST